MSGDPTPSAPAPVVPNGMFSGLNPTPSPAQAPEADFFGAMDAPAPTPHKAAPQHPRAAADPFGGLGAEGPGAGVDLFGGLSVGTGASSNGQPNLMGGPGDSGFADFASLPPTGLLQALESLTFLRKWAELVVLFLGGAWLLPLSYTMFDFEAMSGQVLLRLSSASIKEQYWTLVRARSKKCFAVLNF